MNTSDSTKAISAALSAFQGAVPPIKKGRTANTGSFSYAYADLGDIMDAIRGELAKNGLAVVQSASTDGEYVGVVTRIMHSSGEWIASDTLLLPAGKTPQAAGGSLTYCRRYSLSALLGIATEDDLDAGPATAEAKAHPPKAAPKASTTKQQGLIHKLVKDAGFTEDQLHARLKARFNVDSTKKLTSSQASEIIDSLSEAITAMEGERSLSQEVQDKLDGERVNEEGEYEF